VKALRLLALWALPFVVGCAALGLPTADTFNQKMAVAYGTVTALRTSATTLVGTGKITPDDAQNVLTQTDNARAALDIARVAYKSGDTTGASVKLDTTTTVLRALQAYLASKGA
jgi:predicted outer membrane protein